MKNTTKMTLIMIAVVALGVFSLPSMLAVGTGQHKFNNGGAVQCGKCHANTGDGVYGELQASGTVQYSYYGNQGGKIHNGSSSFYLGGKYNCAACHRTTGWQAGAGQTKADGSHTGVEIKVECSRCHATEYSQLTSANDAHKEFGSAVESKNGTYACIGCHTAVDVTGSPTYTYSGAVTTTGLTIGGGTTPNPSK